MNGEYDLAGKVIGLAMKIHSALGSGFLESVYHKALAHELEKAGMRFESEKPPNVFYDGVIVGEFAADFLVGNELIVELKAVQNPAPAHEVQTVNYLVATGKRRWPADQFWRGTAGVQKEIPPAETEKSF